MKNILKNISLLLLSSVLMLTACGPEMNKVEIKHIPAIDGTKVAPLSDESGAVRAYIGTEVVAEGFNLDKITKITIGDMQAELTEKAIDQVKFVIPVIELEQQDAPHALILKAYGEGDEETPFFTVPYFVTKPVTDARISDFEPKEGTLSTEVTLIGRNLEQVTRVNMNSVKVEAADFVSLTADKVVFKVPVGEYAQGDSEVDIIAEWGSNIIDVTAETKFKMHTPKFDDFTQEVTPKIGDEVVLTGVNLDLVTEVSWKNYVIIIVEQSATAIKVKFPSSIEQEDPIIASGQLSAKWGDPAQSIVVKEAYNVDTTPVGPAAPVFGSFEAEDGGAENKFFLGKKIVVKGQNMASVEGFKVDGVAAELFGEPNDVEATFIVPDGVTFTEATEVPIIALYNGGNEVDFTTAKVYPFYYFKDIKLSPGSSNSTYAYTDAGRQNAFFVPDMGKVITATEWFDSVLDPFAKGLSKNAAISSKNTLNKANITEEQYYAVSPYLFITTDSGGKIGFQDPANSSSQLKCHKLEDGTSISTTYGTPITLFGVKKSGDSVHEAISTGNVTTMYIYDGKCGSSVPAFGKSKNFGVGDVIIMQYSTYSHGIAPSDGGDARKQGYIYVKEVTCSDYETSKVTDMNGYILFDMYWSKVMND